MREVWRPLAECCGRFVGRTDGVQKKPRTHLQLHLQTARLHNRDNWYSLIKLPSFDHLQLLLIPSFIFIPPHTLLVIDGESDDLKGVGRRHGSNTRHG